MNSKSQQNVVESVGIFSIQVQVYEPIDDSFDLLWDGKARYVGASTILGIWSQAAERGFLRKNPTQRVRHSGILAASRSKSSHPNVSGVFLLRSKHLWASVIVMQQRCLSDETSSGSNSRSGIYFQVRVAPPGWQKNALSPTIMVQWKMGVSPIWLSFHSPSLKLTVPPEKWMVGIWRLSLWDGSLACATASPNIVLTIKI